MTGAATTTRRTEQDMLDGGRRPLVAIGGGKDSIVSVEALKAASLRPVVFTVERQPTPLLSEVRALTEVPNLKVRRTVDQRLTHLLDHHGCLHRSRAGHRHPLKLSRLPGLAAMMEEKLERRWSPQQISGWLRRQRARVTRRCLRRACGGLAPGLPHYG
ncbi:MAG: hypothetical protein ACRDRO_30715 [Pseudonocardiaceae bacterium]